MRRLRSPLALALSLGLLSAAVAWQAAPPEPADAVLPVLAKDTPTWWKGNLHTHSLWSDGDDFPEMIADWYRRHGYNFLTLSDHNVLSEGQRWIDVTKRKQALDKYLARFGPGWVERREEDGKPTARLKPLAEFRSVLEEPGRFLLVQGEEITHRYAKAPVHMNAVNLRDAIKPIDGDSVLETIRVNLRAVEEQRLRSGREILTFLNHPNFGWGVRAEDMLLAEELRLFEVFNGHPGVKNYGDEIHPSTERMWDIVLALRLSKYSLPVLYGVATDDAHGYHAFGLGKVNPGRGWVMVKAPYLTAEAVVRAMHAGDFYCSSGVTLEDVRRTGKELALVIRGEPGVTYKTQFVATLRGTPVDSRPRTVEGKIVDVTREYSPDIGKVVAEAEGLTPYYRLTGRELYVRARVVSTKPHPNPYAAGDVEMAWTQPAVP